VSAPVLAFTRALIAASELALESVAVRPTIRMRDAESVDAEVSFPVRRRTTVTDWVAASVETLVSEEARA
jgi:hypothetical protein